MAGVALRRAKRCLLDLQVRRAWSSGAGKKRATEVTEQRESGITHDEFVGTLWATAVADLHLDPDFFWDLTYQEFELLNERLLLRQQREELFVSSIKATIMNMSGKMVDRRIADDEFMVPRLNVPGRATLRHNGAADSQALANALAIAARKNPVN